MSRKYYLKEKYHRKLSYFLLCQMKIMIAVSLAVVGMNSLLTNVHAETETYGIYKYDDNSYKYKVYKCGLNGNSIENEIDIKDVTYLYIAADVTEIVNVKKSPTDEPIAHTVHFLGDDVQTIAMYAFYGFVNLSGPLDLRNQTRLTTIGNYAFFETQLTSVQLPASVNNIDTSAFAECSTLESIIVGNVNITYYSQDGVLFKKAVGNDKEILYRYPEGKTGNDYTIPDGVKTINDYAFKNVNHLKNITISATVTDIKKSAFEGSKVGKVSFEERSELNNIGIYAFADSMLNEITLPDGLETIGAATFNATQLKTINIPQSVTNIDVSSFYNCPNMTAINVAENNQNYKSIDGVLYTNNGEKLISYPTAKSINTYKVKDGVNTIEMFAFSYSKNTPYIIIPNSVNQIENSVFSYSKIKGILFEGTLPTFGSTVFFNANANLKLYTLNSNDVGINTSIGKEILLYKAPILTIENNHEGNPGDTYQMQPTLNDDATFKNDIGYNYTSTDPTIASVNQSGLVTMHKAGTASIKVTAADPFRNIEKIMIVDVKEEINNSGNQETPPTNPNGGTPNQPETVIPNQPEIKPQENQEISGTNSQENKKESQLNHRVKTNDETMIIGMVGMLLLGGIGILSLRRKES